MKDRVFCEVDLIAGSTTGAAFFDAATFVRIEDAFAQTDVLRSGFDELIGVDVFDGAFQGETQRR